jgi:hypothetical protein
MSFARINGIARPEVQRGTRRTCPFESGHSDKFRYTEGVSWGYHELTVGQT